jgi:hypothetical protein
VRAVVTDPTLAAVTGACYAHGHPPLLRPEVDAMRLSNDRARRLSRLVWRERLLRWLPLAAAGLALVGLMAFVFEWRVSHADSIVDVQMHAATVLSAKATQSRGLTVFHVHLDDGRDVDAASLMRVLPAPGTHVVVSESRHASGRLTWGVERVGDE